MASSAPNIQPPTLWRKAVTEKLVVKIVKHDSWPIQPAILNLPLLRLASRKLLWLDLQPIDIKSRWRHNWNEAQVVNSYLVCDPTIRQPGFDLPRQCGLYWTVFAWNRNTVVPVEENCDLQTQICVQLRRDPDDDKTDSGLSRLHSADEEVVSWLTNGSWHAYEKKNWLLLNTNRKLHQRNSITKGNP